MPGIEREPQVNNTESPQEKIERLIGQLNDLTIQRWLPGLGAEMEAVTENEIEHVVTQLVDLGWVDPKTVNVA